MLRIGYSYWGFLGDYKFEGGKEVSTPDGNATYSWALISELQRRRHCVYMMQKDRDQEGWDRLGPELFSAFSPLKRESAYRNMLNGQNIFPELDVLLLEWRFPIPGRNTEADRGKPGYQPDLEQQQRLIDHYRWNTDTKVIIWDLDHKLEDHDEASVIPHAIFETSAVPRFLELPRCSVQFPTIVDDLLQLPTLEVDSERKSVYIGSRYERDEVITKWLKPLSDEYPQQVEFWGNWLKTVDECRKLWPNVSYNDRITTRDFRKVYGTAASVPLLGKQSYLDCGFVTPRPWEALMFGSIPVGLSEHVGIDRYVQPGCIAGDGQDMIEVVETLAGISLKERHRIREENTHDLYFMDARHFVDRIEDVANDVVDLGEDLRTEKEGA